MDHMELLEGIKAHPYMTIIAASVVNGRFTALIVGALMGAGQGNVNPIAVYCIFAVMDVLGDALYYFAGRISGGAGKFFIKKSWEVKLNQLNGGLKKNLPKILFLGKMSLFGSKPIIIAAGMAKMPIVKFWSINASCTLFLCLLYMAVGYFFSKWIL